MLGFKFKRFLACQPVHHTRSKASELNLKVDIEKGDSGVHVSHIKEQPEQQVGGALCTGLLVWCDVLIVSPLSPAAAAGAAVVINAGAAAAGAAVVITAGADSVGAAVVINGPAGVDSFDANSTAGRAGVGSPAEA
mmetsp:Transcript_30858/g.54825  ORF Transcript_30858/g.54825 Transcript_30858/m.54825 type:complete len:136 (+) Transcript_30858:26-433(+)